MSGSVSPGYVNIIILFFILLAFFVVGYGFVITKLIVDDPHSTGIKIIFGATTPVLMLLNVLLLKFTKNKAIIVVSMVLILIIDILYLTGIFDKYTLSIAYLDEASLLVKSIIISISILVSDGIIIGFATFLYWFVKKTKL